MNQEESRIFNGMYNTCLEALYYIVFKQYFDENESIMDNKGDLENRWYINTRNAYYDLALIKWCMVFGSETHGSEPIHYKTLLKYPRIESILKEFDINN